MAIILVKWTAILYTMKKNVYWAESLISGQRTRIIINEETFKTFVDLGCEYKRSYSELFIDKFGAETVTINHVVKVTRISFEDPNYLSKHDCAIML